VRPGWTLAKTSNWDGQQLADKSRRQQAPRQRFFIFSREVIVAVRMGAPPSRSWRLFACERGASNAFSCFLEMWEKRTK
jgi:hypothetical protein